MSDQESPPADRGEGQEPAAVVEGQEPNVEVVRRSPRRPKTEPFDEEYVKDLRKQAATPVRGRTKAEREARASSASSDERAPTLSG